MTETETHPQPGGYGDPLIKAYLERVGKVFDKEYSRRCPKCNTVGEQVAVRWLEGRMQLTCIFCRYEWYERAVDDVPRAEQSWRWALESRGIMRSRSWLFPNVSDETKVRQKADQVEYDQKAVEREEAFKQWIRETYPDLEPDEAV